LAVRCGLAASRKRSFTVRPLTDSTVTTGSVLGVGWGEGIRRIVIPRFTFCVSETVVSAAIAAYIGRSSPNSAALAASFAVVRDLDFIPSARQAL
jgi:hypothetical protein